MINVEGGALGGREARENEGAKARRKKKEELICSLLRVFFVPSRLRVLFLLHSSFVIRHFPPLSSFPTTRYLLLDEVPQARQVQPPRFRHRCRHLAVRRRMGQGFLAG